MKVVKQLAVIVAVASVIAALYIGMHTPKRRAAVATAAPNAAAAPRLTMSDLNGRSLQTADLDGKVVLINFWAAWCTPCTEEIPKLVALQDKYGAQGFQTIGISMEDKESALRDFYRDHKMNYPVVIGNEQIAQQYGGILGLPTTLLVSRDGHIRFKHSGLADFSALEQEVASLLRTPD